MSIFFFLRAQSFSEDMIKKKKCIITWHNRSNRSIESRDIKQELTSWSTEKMSRGDETEY